MIEEASGVDVLTMEQLEAQRQRREQSLAFLEASGAPEDVVQWARKLLRLTQRRIERAKVADYEEQIVRVQHMGEQDGAPER